MSTNRTISVPRQIWFGSNPTRQSGRIAGNRIVHSQKRFVVFCLKRGKLFDTNVLRIATEQAKGKGASVHVYAYHRPETPEDIFGLWRPVLPEKR